MSGVHISPYAGTWYPDEPPDLALLLDERFEESGRRTGEFPFSEALGFVVPHAGPAYSGTVAAAAYRAIGRINPERVVVIGFPHHGGLRGAAVPDVAAIETPLGRVELDTGFGGGFARIQEDRLCDHSVEIQLPFLQKAAPRARVAVLYAGRMGRQERTRVAGLLAAEWRPGTVFVASSDFTHFGRSFGFTPFPADDAAGRHLHDLDFECIEAAGSLDPLLFADTLEQTGATVCGSDPIGLLLETMGRIGSEEVYQTTLDYQTSGEITRDYTHSVSYAALAYCRREAFHLAPDDCDALLESAAETIAVLRRTGERQPFPARGSAALEACRGVFVSLHQDSVLLGCIGNYNGRGPVATQVAEMALSAALDDPRFRPAARVSGPIDIEISVLTPLKRITSPAQFKVGTHGGLLRLHGHAGLLLPQVAENYDWSAEQFLEALARKSGLGPHAWDDPKARLSVFEAQVFSRPGLPGRS